MDKKKTKKAIRLKKETRDSTDRKRENTTSTAVPRGKFKTTAGNLQLL